MFCDEWSGGSVGEGGHFTGCVPVGSGLPPQDRNPIPANNGNCQAPFLCNPTNTPVVQKMGGIAQNGRTGVSEVNAKFDEVYQRGGIYNFMSHPQWLDYGPGKFYETAFGAYSRPSGYLVCAHGALYTYHTVRESTLVRALDPKQSKGRFATYNNLDPHVYMNAITLEFDAGPATGIFPNGRAINERSLGVTDRWNEEYFRREDARIYLTVRPNRILEFR